MAATAKGEKRTRTVSLEDILKRLTPAQRNRVEARAKELSAKAAARHEKGQKSAVNREKGGATVERHRG